MLGFSAAKGLGLTFIILLTSQVVELTNVHVAIYYMYKAKISHLG